MTTEEELIDLREENRVLREVLTQRDEQVTQMQEQITRLSEQVQALHDRLAKDSHNSHLPPSSDRFVRKPKSLRMSTPAYFWLILVFGEPLGKVLHLTFSCTPSPRRLAVV